MPGKVILKIVEGPLEGKVLTFDEHDMLVFGREASCHLSVPGDTFASRHHLMLEINPPRVAVRDLNSLNGTLINGVPFGGRRNAGGEAASEPIALVSGDRLQVGKTVLLVEILEGPAPPRTGAAIKCTMCGVMVVSDAPELEVADYLCDTCGPQAAAEPERFLRTMLQAGVSVRGELNAQDIAGYKVIERLGAGGMSSVHLAEKRATTELVVLKVLHSNMAGSQQNRKSLLREMQVMRSLNHSSIVGCRDYGAAGNTFFFVLDYCNAGTLARLMARNHGKLDWREAMPLFRQILGGLAHAHEQKVVHRDIKPDNIFLHTELGETTAKIGDFGFAKIYTLAGQTKITQPGEYAGSLHFMARDQLLHYKYTMPSSDVWSIAATFYNALTGDYPRNFAGERDPIDVIIEDRIRPIETWGVPLPAPLAGAINKGLASDSTQRYRNAGEFLRALDKV